MKFLDKLRGAFKTRAPQRTRSVYTVTGLAPEPGAPRCGEAWFMQQNFWSSSCLLPPRSGDLDSFPECLYVELGLWTEDQWGITNDVMLGLKVIRSFDPRVLNPAGLPMEPNVQCQDEPRQRLL